MTSVVLSHLSLSSDAGPRSNRPWESSDEEPSQHSRANWGRKPTFIRPSSSVMRCESNATRTSLRQRGWWCWRWTISSSEVLARPEIKTLAKPGAAVVRTLIQEKGMSTFTANRVWNEFRAVAAHKSQRRGVETQRATSRPGRPSCLQRTFPSPKPNRVRRDGVPPPAVSCRSSEKPGDTV